MGEDSRNSLSALSTATPKKPVREFSIHHSLWGMFAIRKGPWKMIEAGGSGGFTFPRELNTEDVGGPPAQLYNFSEDPSETKNVWNEHPDVVAALTSLLSRVRGE